MGSGGGAGQLSRATLRSAGVTLETSASEPVTWGAGGVT